MTTKMDKFEKIKAFYEKADTETRALLESRFPEIKETEDERILRSLITHISIYEGDFKTVGVTRLEILDWLEKLHEKLKKQPENKSEIESWTDEDEKMLRWLCRIIHSQRINKVISLKEENELGKWMDKWLNHNPMPRLCTKPLDQQDREAIRQAIIAIEDMIEESDPRRCYAGFELPFIEVKNRLKTFLNRPMENRKTLPEGSYVNTDEVRENFMNEVYRILNADGNNDRANQIIDAFDSLPAISIPDSES